MHILIAPNAFKNSLNAMQAAIAIQNGLITSNSDFSSVCFPIADGGDGTASLIIEKCKGEKIELSVQDALGRNVLSSFGLIDNGKTAVIEMADASGLKLLDISELAPLKASSYGTGELIKAALDKGADKIILAMGGSATVDGGCGILNALGFTFTDTSGKKLKVTPENLTAVKQIDPTKADPRLKTCEIIILCDVDNMLLGPDGAAAVFGPQKGAGKEAVHQLNDFLTRLSQVAEQQTGKSMDNLKYGGTAGGAAAGLHVFINAQLVSGIEYFLNITGFDLALQKADILITGEGSIDAQTLQGKAPFGAAKRAKANNIPVIGIAGKVPLAPEAELLKYFDVLMAIGNGPADLPSALLHTAQNLSRTAANIGHFLSLGKRRL